MMLTALWIPFSKTTRLAESGEEFWFLNRISIDASLCGVAEVNVVVVPLALSPAIIGVPTKEHGYWEMLETST